MSKANQAPVTPSARLSKIITIIIFTFILVSTSLIQVQASDTQKKTAVATGTIQYAYLDLFEITSNEQQNILIGVGKDGENITDATLYYHNETTGSSFTQKPSNILKEALLFSIHYPESSENGKYILDAVSYQANGQAYHLTMNAAGLDITYGVNQKADTKPDAILTEQTDAPQDILSLAPSGTLSSAATMAAAVTTGEATLPLRAARSAPAAAAKGKTINVVLDAGHGGSDPGAIYQGVNEKDLNLKIAKYAKAELETYAGVNVYLTRSRDEYVALDERVSIAQRKNANILVSLHNNASSNTQARGAGVFIPNESYRPDLADAAQALANIILDRLCDLGLKDWGLFYRNSEVNQYPDGSWKDYYAVIRGSKDAGFVGIIVEHAFMSSSSDMKQYLSSNTKLKNLGIADARAIADYYGLRKKVTPPPIPPIKAVRSLNSSRMSITWESVSRASGYLIYRSRTSTTGSFQKIATIESGTAASYSDNTVASGKNYYYRVRAYRKANGGIAYSPYSGILGARILSKAKINSIQAQSNVSLKLTWAKLGSITGYQIQRSTSPSKGFVTIATIKDISTTSYTDSSIKSGIRYYYRIRGFKKVTGITNYGTFSTITEGLALGKVPITSVRSQSSKKLIITWRKIGGASHYQIFRSTKEDSGFKRITTAAASKAASYIDARINNNTNYYYKIRAINKASNKTSFGRYSNILIGRSLGKVSITSVKAALGGIQVRWKKLTGARTYQIFRSSKKTRGFKKIGSVNAKTLRFKDKKATRRSNYYYRIRATNRINKSIGYGSYSNALKR